MLKIFFLLLTSILAIVATFLAVLIFIQDYDNRLSRESVEREDEAGKVWAVLVAGSRGWDNYRHQADVCHAYQVLHRHGVPDDNIIVMMYDDIAYSEDNPHKGEIYNQPGGENVYAGVKKDYTGEEVTAEHFLSVLKGDKEAVRGLGSGAVLESGPNDDVFIYFADHGAFGIVSFPHDFLSSQTLVATLGLMQERGRFKQALFYLEACESGSMFLDLPESLRVLAVTASNSTAPSYACYYDHTLETFLADVFSISWLDNSDSSNHQTETILNQIEFVANKTSSFSRTSVYGDKDIEKEVLALFQGDNIGEAQENTESSLFSNPVESYDVPMARLMVNKEKNQRKIEELIKQRKEIEETFNKINTALAQYFNAIDDGNTLELDCYYGMVQTIHNHCYNLGENSFALRKLKSLGMFCEEQEFSNLPSEKTKIEIIQENIKEVCGVKDIDD